MCILIPQFCSFFNYLKVFFGIFLFFLSYLLALGVSVHSICTDFLLSIFKLVHLKMIHHIDGKILGKDRYGVCMSDAIPISSASTDFPE